MAVAVRAGAEMADTDSLRGALWVLSDVPSSGLRLLLAALRVVPASSIAAVLDRTQLDFGAEEQTLFLQQVMGTFRGRNAQRLDGSWSVFRRRTFPAQFRRRCNFRRSYFERSMVPSLRFSGYHPEAPSRMVFSRAGRNSTFRGRDAFAIPCIVTLSPSVGSRQHFFSFPF